MVVSSNVLKQFNLGKMQNILEELSKTTEDYQRTDHGR